MIYPQSVHHAHEHVSNELKERCHTIYHMLEISSYTRPQWDGTTHKMVPALYRLIPL